MFQSERELEQALGVPERRSTAPWHTALRQDLAKRTSEKARRIDAGADEDFTKEELRKAIATLLLGREV